MKTHCWAHAKKRAPGPKTRGEDPGPAGEEAAGLALGNCKGGHPTVAGLQSHNHACHGRDTHEQTRAHRPHCAAGGLCDRQRRREPGLPAGLADGCRQCQGRRPHTASGASGRSNAAEPSGGFAATLRLRNRACSCVARYFSKSVGRRQSKGAWLCRRSFSTSRALYGGKGLCGLRCIASLHLLRRSLTSLRVWATCRPNVRKRRRLQQGQIHAPRFRDARAPPLTDGLR